MTYGRAALLVAALTLAACGKPDQAFIDGTPDFNALSMEITGDVSEGAAAQMKVEGTGLAQTESAVGSASAYLIGARDTVAALNDGLRRILTPLANLINSEDPSVPQADLRVYGPKDTAVATFKLTIKRLAADKYGWKLEAKQLGADDSTYVIVMAGYMVKGELPHRGRGAIGINLEAYKNIDTAFKGQGTLISGFAHVGDSKALAYKLTAFTPDTSAHAPLTAAFVGYRRIDTGFTAIRIASWTNINQTATLAPELIRTRLRHKIGVGGRADIVAYKGDIAAGEFYWGKGCWDASEQEGYKVLRHCVTDLLSCTIVAGTEVGSESACSPDVVQDPPTTDESESTMEPGSPDGTGDVLPPATFPTIDG